MSKQEDLLSSSPPLNAFSTYTVVNSFFDAITRRLVNTSGEGNVTPRNNYFCIKTRKNYNNDPSSCDATMWTPSVPQDDKETTNRARQVVVVD